MICYCHLVQQYTKSPHVDFRSDFYCLALISIVISSVGKYFGRHVALSSTSMKHNHFSVTLYFVGHTKVKNFYDRLSLGILLMKADVLWFQVAVNYFDYIVEIIKSLQNLIGKPAQFSFIFDWCQSLYPIKQ